jgi:hypothetical protein
MPYKNPEEQREYLKQWRRQHKLDGLGVIERERMEQCEKLVEAALHANEFVSLRKAVQECTRLLLRLLEGR